MKKIEKTFWVSDTIAEAIKRKSIADYYGLSQSPSPVCKNEITISWKEPEKKVTISESEFDEAVKEFFRCGEREISPMNQGVKMQQHLRQKLFGVE